MNKRKAAIVIACVLGMLALLYIGGLLGQFLTGYQAWLAQDGLIGSAQMPLVSWCPSDCFVGVFTANGLRAMGLLLLGIGGVLLYFKFQNRLGGTGSDPRGFGLSKAGTYGTASWMTEKEMQQMLEIVPVSKAKGTILGEYHGKAVCMPEDTRLNRHIAIFGASGTMKSRAVIRNALF